MGKYDVAMKCSQVKKLIEDNKYKKALEVLDDMDFDKIASMSDLYLFARVYMKADRLEEAKDLYYLAYKHSRSVRALERLIRMSIRTGNIKEARELYLEYEMAAGTTLDTYSLRYHLMKAEGAPREQLISLLEDLKKEEFTEEWGYQLAKLYELNGDAEKCIEVCEDLALWFGVGEIVDKAKALAEECGKPDWVAPKDEEIPEPLEPDRDEELPPSYAQPTVFIHEAGEEIVMSALKNIVIDDSVLGEPVASAQEEPLEDSEEPAEEETLEVPEEPAEEETLEVPEEPAEEETLEVPEEPVEEETLEVPEESAEEETLEVPEMPVKEETLEVPEMPVVKEQPQKEEQLEVLEPEKPVIEQLVPEENVLISSNQIMYYTVKDGMKQVARLKEKTNFVIAGGEEKITLAVAKKIIKQWNSTGNFIANSIGKISADKLNKESMEEKIEKLIGGCLLVLNAEEITAEGAETLWDVMNKEKDNLIVILAGDFERLDSWFIQYSELGQEFGIKIAL